MQDVSTQEVLTESFESLIQLDKVLGVETMPDLKCCTFGLPKRKFVTKLYTLVLESSVECHGHLQINDIMK